MKGQKKIDVVAIDPQKDFMDDGPLPVPGAKKDMDRLAAMVAKYSRKINDIHITLDSHRGIDISHGAFWVGSNGKEPDPFSQITHDSIVNGIWVPRIPGLRQHALDYTAYLEKGGKYVHTIWPTHCLIGSTGHSVEDKFFEAANNWASDSVGLVDFVTKGSDYRVEHFGALEAEMPMPDNPETLLNANFLTTLREADIVLIAGEALSHCVRATVQQIIDNIGDEHIKKIHLLKDCSTSIPAIPQVVDFPALTEAWLKDMKRRGLVITDSVSFWA
jgi:nicotinamidase/pyrazinamidase